MARILVVEDDEDVRDVVCAMLESAGHTVTHAPHGSRGLRLLDDDVDLVVTDLLMPEADGLEVIMAAARRGTRLPVIAISGGGRVRAEDYLRTAARLGATTTLAKPFTREQLLSAVEEALVDGSQ